MSESSPEFQEAKISRTRPPKKEPSQFRGFPAKKLNAGPEGRHFAQATKSSKAKKFSHEVMAKSDAKLSHDSKVRIKCFEQYFNISVEIIVSNFSYYTQRAIFKIKELAQKIREDLQNLLLPAYLIPACRGILFSFVII